MACLRQFLAVEALNSKDREVGRRQRATNSPPDILRYRDSQRLRFLLGQLVVLLVETDLRANHVITFCGYDNTDGNADTGRHVICNCESQFTRVARPA